MKEGVVPLRRVEIEDNQVEDGLFLPLRIVIEGNISFSCLGLDCQKAVTFLSRP
jgi:hypothetical protein